MSLIDIKAVEEAAAKEISEERTKKAKLALVQAMREVASAEDVVRAAKQKLDDLKQRIAEGTF